MAELLSYLEYNDPLIMLHRTGQPGDELKPRTDTLPVINQLVTLLETPSEFHRVQITGMTELTMEQFHRQRSLAPHEYIVNYASGIINFHPSQEGQSKICSYMGRGLILYPASKIYAMASRSPDVVITLQDYINDIQGRLNDAQLAMQQVNEVIAKAQLALERSDMAADNAQRAAQAADEASEAVWTAQRTTKLVFRPPVASEAQLKETYPFPEIGWTVQTYTDGKRYRYDGRKWELIDIFGSNLQPVNEYKDGLMSVAEHLKLQSIPLEVKERVVVFCLPYVVQGPQEPMVRFPYDGELVAIEAFCGMAGETETELYVEKSRNAATWHNVLEQRMRMAPFARFDDQSYVLAERTVEKGDVFRVHIYKQGLGLQNVTVQLTIRT